MSFKIVYKEKEFEKKLLASGKFADFDWNKIRDNIIRNSRKHGKEIKDKDDFILEFVGVPKNFTFQLSSIWNKKTYNFFLDTLNTFKENNQNEELKFRFALSKVDKLPKWNVPKYDIILKEAMVNTWKNEEEKIKLKLNNYELTNRKNDFLKVKRIEEVNENRHNNIICNSCLSIDFLGPRFMCSYCNNYNLCRKCYNLGNHNAAHNFIIFRDPVLDDDIRKYNNKFSPSTEILKNLYDSFKVSFKIANVGENNLKNCYITYINFNGNYLWCEKFIIKDNFERNNTIEAIIKMNFKDQNNNKNGMFEGHLRMFNQNGVPFGDVLKIRVKNEKV